MELMVGQAKVELYQGDITELEVDAIVNAANDRLRMGRGVAGAIKRKGGQIIEDEAVRQGPIPVGEAVVTTAGTLKAKYVSTPLLWVKTSRRMRPRLGRPPVTAYVGLKNREWSRWPSQPLAPG